VSEVWAAEVAAVATDSVIVTFVTEPDVAVAAAVGDHESRTTGPFHVIEAHGLAPDTEYPVAVDGIVPDDQVPAVVRTLAAPAGPPLATIATVNDVHFGETVCGMIHDTPEEVLGPWVRSAPGEDPYPVMMNNVAVAEIDAVGPDAVIAKGDLTCIGSEEEYQLFLDTYARFGDGLHHVRGNHDAMLDPMLAVEGAPYAIEIEGARGGRHRAPGRRRRSAHEGSARLARGNRGRDERSGARVRSPPDLGPARGRTARGLLRHRPRQQ
jgi:hypothetical protein